MPRPWNILEQVIVEPAVRLRFEFTSEHTKSVEAGEEPPYHDRAVVLNVYNETGSRIIRMSFTRGGDFVSSEVESNESRDVPLTEQEKIEQMMKVGAANSNLAAERTAMERGAPDPHWAGETTQEAAWKGINLAQRFASDIE